jgi:hypothetical protein
MDGPYETARGTEVPSRIHLTPHPHEIIEQFQAVDAFPPSAPPVVQCQSMADSTKAIDVLRNFMHAS